VPTRPLQSPQWSASTLGAPETWPAALRARAELVLESAQPTFFVWEPHDVALYNEAFAALLGEPLPTPPCRPWPELVRRFGPGLVSAIDRALRGEAVPMDRPHRLVGRDGAPGPALRLAATPVRGDDGRPAGAFCVGEAATSAMHHREAALLRQLLESAPLAIAIVEGPALRFSLVSRTYQALVGPDRPLVGRTYAEVFPEAAARGAARGLRRVMETGRPRKVRDFVTPLGDREETWWEGEALPLADEAGEIDAALILTWEITERRQFEEALRESETRFREMADGLPLIVWVHDARGQQEMVNATFCEFFGVTREEMKGGRWRMLMHPDDAEAYDREFLACVRERRPFHAEVRVRRGDGRWRWLESWGRPRFTATGEYRGFIGTSADVTERKDAEEQLREADRRKDEFLAMLGHELRNPLAAIENATELVKPTDTADPHLERAHEVLARQSRHMARLIDGLLEVSRIARGKIEVKREPLDLRRLLEGVLDDHEARVRSRGLTLARELPDEPVWIRGDAVRLTQVFGNLLANALQFTEAPGRITVALHREAGEAVAVVRDTGAGIRPELLPGIFEPFQQEAQDIARTEGGLGLGLALAKALVELHDGAIEARSDGVGHGAELRVHLPPSAPPRAADDARADGAAPPRRVLVVEDNADAAEMLQLLLETRGHEVAVAGDAPEALERLRGGGADVILCDLGLPGTSGFELARAIREDAALREVSLVALTGYGQPEDRRRTAAAGFDAHLVKPVSVADLERVLRELPRRAAGGAAAPE
jgi:PAS domain S-box-containing protein